MSRIVAGKVRLRRQPVDLASIIEAAVAAIRPAAEAKGIPLDPPRTTASRRPRGRRKPCCSPGCAFSTSTTAKTHVF